jgi:hypothetical protein
MNQDSLYVPTSLPFSTSRDDTVLRENHGSIIPLPGKPDIPLSPLTLNLNDTRGWVLNLCALDHQQRSGSMIIVWYPDIDECAGELDTEQTLAGSKRSREYVIFKGYFFT